MAVARLIIAASMQGQQQVQQGITGIGSAAKGANSSLGTLTAALAAVGALQLGKRLQEYADGFINLQNKLRVVVSSTEELSAVTQNVFEIAQRSRSDLDATAKLYQRTALAAKQLGRSQEEVAIFTETLNKAIVISGASTIEASNAMIQLSQGIAKGVLNGDELRSVLEQLPFVADLIANEMGVLRGELRQLGADGKITSDIILNSLINAAGGINELFGQMKITIGQAFVVLNNAVFNFIGRLDEATGVSQFFAKAIIFMANNIQYVAAVALPALFYALGLLASYFLPLVTAAFWRLNAAMLANPFIAIATAVVAFGTLLVILYQQSETFRAAVGLLWQGLTFLWNIFVQLAQVVGQMLMPVWNAFVATFNVMLPLIQATWVGLQQFWAVLTQVWQVLVQMLPSWLNWQVIGQALVLVIQVLGLTISTLITASLVPLVAGLYAVTSALHAFGLVSDDTMNRVRDAASEFFKFEALVKSAKGIFEGTAAETKDLAKELNWLAEAAKNAKGGLDGAAKSTSNLADEERKAKGEVDGLGDAMDVLNRIANTLDAILGRLGSLTLPSLGSSATAAAGDVNSLTNAINSSVQAAQKAQSAYQSMGSAASGVGRSGGGDIMDSPFFGSMSSSGGKQYTSTLGRALTPGEEFRAGAASSAAKDLFNSGQISSKKFDEYMNFLSQFEDGRLTAGEGGYGPAGIYDIYDLYNEIIAKQNKIALSKQMADAASKPGSVNDFQTYWPWQNSVGFDTGAHFRVPGNIGNTDTVNASLRLSPGEEVFIRAAGKRGRPDNDSEAAEQKIEINFYVDATDAPSFLERPNQAQIQGNIRDAVLAANRRDQR